MNAMEAMELSNANIPKLADIHFKSVIEKFNEQIVNAAKNGKFTASISILPIENANIQNEVIDRLVIHYQDLGYKVKTHNHYHSKMILVSWQKEPTSCN